MDQLVQQLKVVLGSTFAFYLKAHNFHWNIEGPNFPQYHSFLDGLYNEVWGAVDAIAEHIRTLDAYAPGSLGRFSQLSVVDDQINIPNARAMFSELESDNQKVIAELTKAYVLAEKENKPGLSNFLQDRIDIHAKHAWMLKATGK
jgi:starvation-inducible DNA-binding protein